MTNSAINYTNKPSAKMRRVYVPVQLEGIRPISVSGILFQVFWKVDDFNGIKWAFLQQRLHK